MSKMSSIPGTPDWIKAGGKTGTVREENPHAEEVKVPEKEDKKK